MKELSTLKYHKLSEEIVEAICKKTQNKNTLFFRILIAYHLSKLASNLRIKLKTKDRGDIPVNCYAINISPSGEGKTYSTNIMEYDICGMFKSIFFDQLIPIVEGKNLAILANKRAAIKGADPDEELLIVEKEYKDSGPLPFAFDSGTTPALKQLRHRLLMSKIGAMSLQTDEIGNNLLSNADLLGTLLESYDQGLLKQKITKNTKENKRNEEIDGSVPTNMLLFGTGAKLLNGSKIEEEFFSFLETGYARRCLFGYTKFSQKNTDMSPEDIYDMLTDTNLQQRMKQIAVKLAKLASLSNYNRKIIVNKEVSLLLIKYRIYCEEEAAKLEEFAETQKAELNHRYFKALKLSGTYAFVDDSPIVTKEHLYNAIALVEESGRAFNKIIKRERNYTKLAKYIASTNQELTHADLTEDLPFYKGGIANKRELMDLAIGWGYKNHIIIQKVKSNDIEFFKGKSLEKTNLNELIMSYSSRITEGYKSILGPFDKLEKFVVKPNLNFINHFVTGGYRDEEHIKTGFNMIVLDIDDGVDMNIAMKLLKQYSYSLYTTKRHKVHAHRFRLILPITYILNLSEEDYKEFMKNFCEWLPFKCDHQANQRSRKWATNSVNVTVKTNITDKLIDPLPFIPKTTKCEEFKKQLLTQQSLTNLERWFISKADDNGRNNQLIRYGLILVDSGLDEREVKNKILMLNNKLKKKMKESEIKNTIFKTIAKQFN